MAKKMKPANYFFVLGALLLLIRKRSGMISSAADFISDFEGYHTRLPDGSAKAYPDPGYGWQVPTIGFGTTVYPNGQKVKKGDIITREQAEQYLMHEVDKKQKAILAKIKVPYTQNQLDALTSFAYNAGTKALFNSGLWNKFQSRQPASVVAAEFGKWVYSNGEKMPGLVDRRAAEKKLFLS